MMRPAMINGPNTGVDLNIAIIGTGYVGLVTGVCLARAGHHVTCVDRDPSRIEHLRAGAAPFYEPGLDAELQGAYADGTFAATTDTAAAVKAAELVFVTVGTPSTDGKIDLEQIGAVLDDVGAIIARDDTYRTIVIKSTVVPSTTDGFAIPRLERTSGKRAGRDFGIAMNPEFLREGCAIGDFTHPDRIVIGELDTRSGDLAARVYESYDCPKIRTSLRNAELIKYSSNALLATLISFSNEIATICESIPGLDVDAVMDGLHLDRRLSPLVEQQRVTPDILSYLRAGAGFGGSCLPKDVSALRAFASDNDVPMPLLDAVLQVNAERPAAIVRILREELGDLRDRTIAILGLAFKAGTDDLRESASLRVAALLLAAGANVRAFDPVALKYGHNAIDARIAVAADGHAAFDGADAVVLMTAWPEFTTWPLEELARTMRSSVFVDGRGALRKQSWPAGTRYRTIGTTRTREAANVG